MVKRSDNDTFVDMEFSDTYNLYKAANFVDENYMAPLNETGHEDFNTKLEDVETFRMMVV